jgi:hypothetical protein
VPGITATTQVTRVSSPLPPLPQSGTTQPAHGPIEPRVVAAGAGATWWAEGWRTFTSQIGTWIGVVIVYLVVSLLLSKVPYLGGVAQWLLTGLRRRHHAGLQCAGSRRAVARSHLFDGFKGRISRRC